MGKEEAVELFDGHRFDSKLVRVFVVVEDGFVSPVKAVCQDCQASWQIDIEKWVDGGVADYDLGLLEKHICAALVPESEAGATR